MRGAQRWQQAQSEKGRRKKKEVNDIVASYSARGERHHVRATYPLCKHRPRALASLLKHPEFDYDFIMPGDGEQVGAALDVLCKVDGVAETARLLGRMYRSERMPGPCWVRLRASRDLRNALFWQCVRGVPNYGSCPGLYWMDDRDDTMLFVELARRAINDYGVSPRVRGVLEDERQALYDSINLPLELVNRVYDFMRPVIRRSTPLPRAVNAPYTAPHRDRWQLPLALGDRWGNFIN
jgi:hypothetical protein